MTINIKWSPPGQRIIKTAVAVTLCLLFYMLRGYEGDTMPGEAAITAIICMQPLVHGTTENALNRFIGTIIGAVLGFLFLLIVMQIPALEKDRVILYLLMGFGTMVALHAPVLLHKPDVSGLSAIVFVCIVIAFPDIENPLDQAFHRLFHVMVGVSITIIVNGIRLPRIRHPNKVFFLPLMFLRPDQFTQLSPAVLFHLQSLYQEGAKICLMSKHAPAFHASQLGHMPFTVPMIVMDGAAIYDPNENTYIAKTSINQASCRWLMKALEGNSYFIYTVHQNRNCIYHHGELTDRERIVYQYLKKSPYRYYLDDDHFSVSEVLYIKIVTSRDEADRIQRELEPMLNKMKLRSVVRPQAGLDDGCSLYFYAEHADMQHAQQHLMRLLQQENPDLEAQIVVPDRVYRTENDAIRLLRELRNEYAPYAVTEWINGRTSPHPE